MNSWDKKHEKNFDVLFGKMKFIPSNRNEEWHIELAPGTRNLYFDEIAFMIEYLEAIGELRFKANTGSPRKDLF